MDFNQPNLDNHVDKDTAPEIKNPTNDSSQPMQGYQPTYQQQTQPQNNRCPRCSNVANQRFCSYCGFDILLYQQQYQAYQQQYQAYQQPQSAYYCNQPQPQFYNQNYVKPQGYQASVPYKKPKTALIITMVSLIFVALSAGIIWLVSNYIPNSPLDLNRKNSITYNDSDIIPNGVSIDEYNKLKVGMSYAHVSSIIGGDGVVTNQGETPLGESFITFTWVVETNEEAFVHITFIQDAVSDIVEDGLFE